MQQERLAEEAGRQVSGEARGSGLAVGSEPPKVLEPGRVQAGRGFIGFMEPDKGQKESHRGIKGLATGLQRRRRVRTGKTKARPTRPKSGRGAPCFLTWDRATSQSHREGGFV